MAEIAEVPRFQYRQSSQQSEDTGETLDVLQILRRQRWMIVFFSALGLACGIAYALNAQVWYQSQAKVLINEKSAGLGSGNSATAIVDEDILANHMELLRSRKIVGEALAESGLMGMESIKPHLIGDQDAVDFVIDRLELTKGGGGSAKTARSLMIALKHTDPEDAQTLLTAVMARYKDFIVDQVEDVMKRADNLVEQAKNEVEADLIAAEEEHLNARQNAPLFFQGEGSSNVYQDRYRRLQEEMLDIDIKESTVKTRLDRVNETLAEMDKTASAVDNLDKLALIDSESLERLGVFAGLQMNAANTAEFKAAMPAKMEEARTQITHLLRLNSEKQRLNAIFGPGHPKVIEIENEITLVKTFLKENEELSKPVGMIGENTLTPETLLKAYIGFLNHDLGAYAERRRELEILAKDAEGKAKDLIEYELNDMVLRSKIRRQEALFDGLMQQLRDLDTASSLSGYLYEFLEVPRLGKKVWPNPKICGLGGLMMGLFLGLFLAVANDIRDGRFRSVAEIDEAIDIPSLGRVGKLNSINQGIRGLLAAENSPNAEAFRLGRTMLLPDINSGKLRVIGFTSPMQGDGKSTVVSNFAVSFSQVGLRVLVVDADMRRPSVHNYFSVPRLNGLCDVLDGRAKIQDVIKQTEAEGVSVISSGNLADMPAEMLQGEAFDNVIAEVRDMYDLVLVDMPPVLAVSDPVVVMPKLDGGVLVVRVSSARRDEVMNTIRRVQVSGANFVGCMLNTHGAGKEFETDGGYYGYYNSDYTRSGSKETRRRIAKPIGSVPTNSNGQSRDKD